MDTTIKNTMFSKGLTLAITLLLAGCSGSTKAQQDLGSSTAQKRNLSQTFKAYWYAGEAEISSYSLEQVRYGEIREGKTVLIYVTEPFLQQKQVKADDYKNPDATSVLKLNRTKNFVTGIYPYSIMHSTFHPLSYVGQPLKATASVQEWCGQWFLQMNNRDQLEFKGYSYFEKEGDQQLEVGQALLEDGIWTQIRIAPDQLPEGNFEMVPGLTFFRLSHAPIGAYAAKGNLEKGPEQLVYTLEYPKLGRQLSISFEKDFPHHIISWLEKDKQSDLITTATRLKTLKTSYWKQNSNTFAPLRDSLQLK